MSKITVIACSHIIILTGYNQTKRKTEKTEGRSQTRLDYAEVHPVFAGTLKAYEKEQFLGDGDSHSDSRTDGSADRAGNNEFSDLKVQSVALRGMGYGPF